MKTFLTYLVISLFLYSSAFSQKARNAEGDYTMKIENNMTLDEAVKNATLQAQINAIENAFGKVISQQNSSYIQNKESNSAVQTNTTFNFISNSYVKGEWVEDTRVPDIERIIRDKDVWIKVKVYGRVREITTPDNSFEAATLGCPDVKCRTQKFNDGQDLYLYFKSAQDGFVSVYVTDPDMKYTFMLLPYKGSVKNKKNVPVKADVSYIFFSKKFDYFNEIDAIDEQIVNIGTNSQFETYQAWILFSPNELEKPMLEDEADVSKKFLDGNLIKTGYSLPKAISDDKFREWLQRYRIHNKQVQLATFLFDVNK